MKSVWRASNGLSNRRYQLKQKQGRNDVEGEQNYPIVCKTRIYPRLMNCQFEFSKNSKEQMKRVFVERQPSYHIDLIAESGGMQSRHLSSRHPPRNRRTDGLRGREPVAGWVAAVARVSCVYTTFHRTH